MDDQTFLNQLAEKLGKLGTVRPLGFHYLHPYGTVPADSIICNGATYSRALYKDFFDYITAQRWVKTEAEWQKIATRDNGFCPFYSSGDGSTNFRTPKFAPYQQIATTSGGVGNYHKAGLPNINGEQDGTSLYNPIYGRSTTVQPEAHEWVMCVVAYGVATNVGSVDMANVLTAVAQVQASVAAIPRANAYVTKTWRSGTEWYRTWSDGWIDQGGHGTNNACTFSKPFTNIDYTFNVQPSSDYWSHPDWIATYENRPSRTKTGTGITWYEGGDLGWDWRASGY